MPLAGVPVPLKPRAPERLPRSASRATTWATSTLRRRRLKEDSFRRSSTSSLSVLSRIGCSRDSLRHPPSRALSERLASAGGLRLSGRDRRPPRFPAIGRGVRHRSGGRQAPRFRFGVPGPARGRGARALRDARGTGSRRSPARRQSGRQAGAWLPGGTTPRQGFHRGRLSRWNTRTAMVCSRSPSTPRSTNVSGAKARCSVCCAIRMSSRSIATWSCPATRRCSSRWPAPRTRPAPTPSRTVSARKAGYRSTFWIASGARC